MALVKRRRLDSDEGGKPHSSKIMYPREGISSVEFGIFSAEEIRRLSVCTITESSMYSASLPANNSVVDFRMGSVDRRLNCGTCKRSVTTCPGHYGCISLAYPVFHPGFIDVILKLLRSVCYFCSHCLLNEDIQQLNRLKERKQKLSSASTLGKGKKICPSCNGKQPVYSKNGMQIRTDWSKVVFEDPDEQQYCQRCFTAAEARMILRHISQETCDLLI